MTRSEMVKAVSKLDTGERFIVPESDYGKAEIWRVNDVYLLFEIPMYGGEPYFHAHYNASEGAEKIVDFVMSWT